MDRTRPLARRLVQKTCIPFVSAIYWAIPELTIREKLTSTADNKTRCVRDFSRSTMAFANPIERADERKDNGR
jgi:hypothetical protein